MALREENILIDHAIAAAKIGGQILLQNYGKLDPATIEEKSAFDFVTAVDHQSEQAIIHYLKSHFPEHTILAEESGIQQTVSEYRWIIDPLDGTKNYIHLFPWYAVSVALEYKNEIVVGVVYNPVRDELFTAEKGQGAYLNGNRIGVSQCKNLAQSMLATGFPHRSKMLLNVYLKSFSQLFQKVSAIRRLGSAAIDLCYVACGRVDGFWELKLSAWDIAAGTLIVQEAGGRVGDLVGGQNHLETGNILAANAYLYEPLLNITRTVFRGHLECITQ